MDEKKLACDTCEAFIKSNKISMTLANLSCRMLLPCWDRNGNEGWGSTADRNPAGLCEHHTERPKIERLEYMEKMIPTCHWCKKKMAEDSLPYPDHRAGTKSVHWNKCPTCQTKHQALLDSLAHWSDADRVATNGCLTLSHLTAVRDYIRDVCEKEGIVEKPLTICDTSGEDKPDANPGLICHWCGDRTGEPYFVSKDIDGKWYYKCTKCSDKHKNKPFGQPDHFIGAMCGCALIPEPDIMARINNKLHKFKSKHYNIRETGKEVVLELGSNAYEQLKKEAFAISGYAPAEAGVSENYYGHRIIKPNNVGAGYIEFELIDKPQGICLPMCNDWGAVFGKNPGCYHGLKEDIDGMKGNDLAWAAMNAKTELTIGQPCPHGKGWKIEKVEKVSK